MPHPSEPGRWVGRSGRIYVLDPDGGPRDGGMASIRRVLPQSPPNAVSTVPEGTVLALKLARSDDKLAEEALAREVESFVALSRAPGSPPCPRLYDIVGNPVTGIVMEWCPTDMERWWEATWSESRAFVELCEALADICRRVREYAAVAELELGKRVIHADIKPRNVLRAVDGRWLLTDFGAAKSRSVDETQWAATRMILGTENFIAPEALFNARKPHPAAMDTWSIGCTFFALLRMRTLLRGGGKLPANGTHAHLFRSQRVALVGDLQQRKPALFVDKDLDPAQFASPEKLPEKDRRAVAEALDGIYGKPNPTLEGVLATEVLHLLDRALRIDPAARFRDPLEMAGEFEALAQRYRELALRADGGIGSARMGGSGEVRGEGTGGAGSAEASAPEGTASGPRGSGGTAGSGPKGDGRRGAASAPPAERPPGAAGSTSPPGRGDASGERAREAARAERGGASAPRLLVGEEIEVQDGTGKRAAPTAPAPRAPRWMSAALIVVIALQGVQIGVGILVLMIALDARSTAADALEMATAARAQPPGTSPAAASVVTTGPAASAPSAPPLAALVEEAEAVAAPTTAPAAASGPAPSDSAAGTAPAGGAGSSGGTASGVASAAGAGGRPTSSSKATAAPASAAPSTGTGLVLVSGAQAYLVGPSGRMPVGGVAVGTYELFAQTRADGEFESQGTVHVGAGERIVYKCGFGTCRRSP